MPVTTSNISTVYQQELTRDQLLTRACQLAGVTGAETSPSADKLSLLADLLMVELDALQAKGIVLRTIVNKTLTLSDATASYALPADTLDIVGVAMMTPTTGSQTPVQPMERDEYFQIANKTAAGTPTRYYLERLATTTVYLWPVLATGSSATFSYQQVRLLKDTDSGSKTFDLERYWLKYLLWEMAHQAAVANAVPMDKVVYLRGQSVKLLSEAMSYNRPHGPTRIIMGHRPPYWT